MCSLPVRHRLRNWTSHAGINDLSICALYASTMRFPWGGNRSRTDDRVETLRLQVRCRCSKRLLDVDATFRAVGAVFTLDRADGYPEMVTCPRCATTWEVGPTRLWDLAATTTVHGERSLSIEAVGVGGSTSRMIQPVELVQPATFGAGAVRSRIELDPAG